MKKITLLICAIVLMSGSVFAQNFDFGIGLTSGTKMKFNNDGYTTGFGINARGVFSFAHKFGVLGGVSYYLPSKYTETYVIESENSFLVMNADFIFYLLNIPKTKLYALGGVAYTTHYHNSILDGMDHKFTTKTTGLEVGAGLKATAFFVEAKYDFKVKQVLATIGIYF